MHSIGLEIVELESDGNKPNHPYTEEGMKNRLMIGTTGMKAAIIK